MKRSRRPPPKTASRRPISILLSPVSAGPAQAASCCYRSVENQMSRANDSARKTGVTITQRPFVVALLRHANKEAAAILLPAAITGMFSPMVARCAGGMQQIVADTAMATANWLGTLAQGWHKPPPATDAAGRMLRKLLHAVNQGQCQARREPSARSLTTQHLLNAQHPSMQGAICAGPRDLSMIEARFVHSIITVGLIRNGTAPGARGRGAPR